MEVYIYRPSSTRFVARVRLPGHRLYRVLGEYRDEGRATRAMAREFSKGIFKRGDVIMTAHYYDPVKVCEMVRR